MRSRVSSERGQTTSEYMGGLLVVSAIAALLAATALGPQIAFRTKVLICQIGGGTNCEQTAGGNPRAPDPSECIIRDSDKEIDGSVKVLVFKLSGGLKGVYQVAADGTTTVTIQADAGAGLDFATPGVKAGDGDTEASSPKGEFEVSGQGEFARSWTFKSEDDADSFIHHMVDKVIAESDLIPNFLQSADNYDPPAQSSDTIYGGVSVSGSVSAGGGGAYAEAGGGVEAGVGATYDANGDKTYFFRAKANVDAKAGLSFAGGFGVGGDGEVTLGITYDSNGNEKSMTVEGSGSVSGGVDLTGETDLSGLMRGLEQATTSGSSRQGKQVQFESELDLTNPENARVADEFLHGTDPDTGQSVDLGTATSDLYRRFDADAQTNVRLYDLDSTNVGVDVDGTVLGFSLKYSSHDAHLTNAWFDPGPGGFQPWYDCSNAAKANS